MPSWRHEPLSLSFLDMSCIPIVSVTERLLEVCLRAHISCCKIGFIWKCFRSEAERGMLVRKQVTRLCNRCGLDLNAAKDIIHWKCQTQKIWWTSRFSPVVRETRGLKNTWGLGRERRAGGQQFPGGRRQKIIQAADPTSGQQATGQNYREGAGRQIVRDRHCEAGRWRRHRRTLPADRDDQTESRKCGGLWSGTEVWCVYREYTEPGRLGERR